MEGGIEKRREGGMDRWMCGGREGGMDGWMEGWRDGWRDGGVIRGCNPMGKVKGCDLRLCFVLLGCFSESS